MANEKRLIVASELGERVYGIGIYLSGLRNGKTLVKEAMEKYRNEVLRTICTAPTVDAVEVVRCKDCRHWVVNDDVGYCDNPDGLDNYARPEDFCSYGERKGNG